MPNARVEIRTPGAACRRLYSARSTRSTTRRTTSPSNPAAWDVGGRPVVLDIGLEDSVEDIVRGQAVGIELVLAEFGRGRLVDDSLRG